MHGGLKTPEWLKFEPRFSQSTIYHSNNKKDYKLNIDLLSFSEKIYMEDFMD